MKTNLTPEVLRKAADLAESISKMQAQLNALLADKVTTRKTRVSKSDKIVKTKNGQVRHYSAQARKKIAEAQRRRHAAARAAKEAATTVTPVTETVASAAA